MFNDCIREPQSSVGTLTISKSRGRLNFARKAEYKCVDLLWCDFTASSEEIVHQQIMHRYNAIKSKLAFVQSRLADIDSLAQLKNPSLLSQLHELAGSKKVAVAVKK
eukprot:TRINITY_DN2285_c0_g1_i7.p2 TRINITY_DN2285_c0_g1~~TRINITY_DN2285_c0_g1_i7.p2  ORF type:complete len:107 (-),score=30.20 TRINITY_DN2285_c0_g1_i7:133-453(-)